MPNSESLSLRFYLFRHGTTVWNEQRKYSGNHNVSLTQAGRETFLRWRNILSMVSFQTVYCSPLERAYESASLLVQGRNIPIRPDRRLRELDFGEWEGMEFTRVPAEFPEEYANWKKNPWHHAPPGGESLRSVARRIRSFFNDVLQDCKEGDIAVVSHTVPMKISLSYMFNINIRVALSFYLSPGGLCMVDRNPVGQFRLRSWNVLPENPGVLSSLPRSDF